MKMCNTSNKWAALRILQKLNKYTKKHIHGFHNMQDTMEKYFKFIFRKSWYDLWPKDRENCAEVPILKILMDFANCLETVAMSDLFGKNGRFSMPQATKVAMGVISPPPSQPGFAQQHPKYPALPFTNSFFLSASFKYLLLFPCCVTHWSHY